MRRIIVAGLCVLLILVTACVSKMLSGDGLPPDASKVGVGNGGRVVEYDGWVYFLSADITSMDDMNVQALPPGSIAPVLWPEAGHVRNLYAVDGALYFSRYGDTLSCPAGGGGMTVFVPGMLADFDAQEGVFYYTRWGEANTGGLYRVASDGSGDQPIFEGNCTYLTHTDDAVYFYTLVGEELTLYRAGKDGKELTILSQDPALSDGGQWGGSEITEFAFCDGWMVWVQGSYQGSAGFFYGTLMRARPDGSEKVVLWENSVANFRVSDGWIYYDSFADPVDKEDEGIYRIRPDQTEAEFVGGGGPSSMFTDGALYYNKNAGLWTSEIDGTGAYPLFDGGGMVAEYSGAYVPYCYPDAVLGDWVYFTASAYGHPPGSNWHIGAKLVSCVYRVRRDGSELHLLHETNYFEHGYPCHYRDSAVKAAVDEVLGRTADTLNRADLETLAEMEALEVSGQIGNLADLRDLFPNLKFLRLLLFPGGLDTYACAVLESLPNLRGISLYISDGEIASLDFLDGLTYVELAETDFTASALCGADTVREHMTRTVGTYVRILDGDMAYELVSAMIEDDEGEFLEHETCVFVSRKESGGYALHTVIDGVAVANDTGLILCDVDFDGQKDLLVAQGHFGAQGLVIYSCYLRRGDKFVLCPSFAEIPNPSIDVAGQKILSTVRHWAASHGWAMYKFQNGAFVRTDQLTGEIDLEYKDEEVRHYIDEVCVNGVWQTREVLNTKDNTEDEIWKKIYAEDSYWGLTGEKWKTLFNGDSMIDFSIYGDGLNAMESALLGE